MIAPGLLVNLLSLPTAKAMSGLVQVMAYIKDHMTFEYSNWEIGWLVCLAKFIPGSMGIETGALSIILRRCSLQLIFLTYYLFLLESDQIRPDQIRSELFRSDQKDSDQTRPDQTISDQIRSDQTRSERFRSDQTESDQIRPDQIRSDQTLVNSDLIQSDQTKRTGPKTKRFPDVNNSSICPFPWTMIGALFPL